MRDTMILTKIKAALRWLGVKVLEAIVVVLVGSFAYIVGNGLLQCYLLPERLQRTDEAMQKKFEERLAMGKSKAIEREASLLQKLEDQRKKFEAEISDLRKELHLPPKDAVAPATPDAELMRYKYIEANNKAKE